MLVVGIILTILGAGSLIYGITQMTGMAGALYDLANAFGANAMNPGLIWIIAGGVVLIVGIILMIVGKKKTAKS